MRKKLSKTFTIEDDTLKIIEKLMEENNLSSYSVALERIVLEWAIIKENKVNTDDIVKKVLEELAKNNISYSKQVEEEQTHNSIIKSMFDNMPK